MTLFARCITHNYLRFRACLGGIAALLVPYASAHAATALIPGYFMGQAISIAGQVQAGPLGIDLSNAAVASCPCRGTNGRRQVTTVTALNLGPVLTAGVNRSTSYGLKTATTADTKQTSDIAKVNLLGGLITADAIHSSAEVSATQTAMSTLEAGSSFLNLVIAGKKVIGPVKPNTTLALPGIGSVTLKYVNAITYGSDAAGVEVEMVRIQISETNSFGLPVGTTLVVGEAFAGFARDQPIANVGGFAEILGVTANAGALLNEAASAGSESGIPSCIGTAGKVLTNSVADVDAPGLLLISAGSTSAVSTTTGRTTIAMTSASVGKVSLLGGLITADTITAVAQEARTGSISTPSSSGSSFGNLNVGGVAIASNVAPNTIVSLPGIGIVVLNEQPAAVANSVQVNGIHIKVTLANSLGLDVGAEIFVAHADATASPS